MAKNILLVHGRSYKPPKQDLQKLWFDALRFGVARDRPDKVTALKAAKLEFAYFGDISNKFLSDVSGDAIPNDIADRRAAFDDLKRYEKNQFTKSNYKKIPGYNPWMEAAADAFSGLLNVIGLADNLIERVAPDMQHYWGDFGFGEDVRAVFTDAIIKAMKRSGDICVISHSLGTMIAYDVFWKLSHRSEYRDQPWRRRISQWITLGSPLADETVKNNLKGSHQPAKFRYPNLVERWLNIAAEDDYISHDQTVAGDFKQMKKLRYVNSITDRRIYNLAVRAGKSNPHHAVGYLVHPTLAAAVADWV